MVDTNLASAVPPRLSGRIAEHVPEIQNARARGVSWSQITAVVGPAIGIDPAAPGAASAIRGAFARAVRQIEKGKLRAGPQGAVSRDTAPTQGAALAQRSPRSLPVAGGKSEEENAAALRAAGIKVAD